MKPFRVVTQPLHNDSRQLSHGDLSIGNAYKGTFPQEGSGSSHQSVQETTRATTTVREALRREGYDFDYIDLPVDCEVLLQKLRVIATPHPERLRCQQCHIPQRAALAGFARPAALATESTGRDTLVYGAGLVLRGLNRVDWSCG